VSSACDANMIIIIAKELAKEIRERFDIRACAVPTLYYSANKHEHDTTAGIDDKLINAYTIVCSGFTITVRSDTITFTESNDDDPHYSGIVQNLQHVGFSAVITKCADNVCAYDLSDPNSINFILDRVKKCQNMKSKDTIKQPAKKEPS